MMNRCHVIPLVLILFGVVTAGSGTRGLPCDRNSPTDQDMDVIYLSQSWLWDPYDEAVEDWQLYKRPTCIEAGFDGDIFVADTGNARIVRFRESGEHEIIGRSGAGPGEFERPVDIHIDHENRLLWVADVSLQRINLFHLQEGGTLFLTSYRIPYLRYSNAPHLIPSPVDTSFYFLSEMPDQRIRQVSRDGEILRAFGEDLEPPDPSWRVYNQGFLCITASRQLIFVSQFGPLVEKYNLEGELMASVPYLEEQYERSVEATKRERRQTGMQNIIGSFFDGAYVTPGSNEVYIVKGAYLFYVIDTTTMQMIREIQVTNPDHEHPIMFFCVVKPEGSENGPIIYGLEFMTNGIKKLVLEHQRRCALSPGSASDR